MKTNGKWNRLREWLAGLSFRTGLVVGAVCLLCYALSFAQMALPLSAGAKAVLWAVFFGMAKAAQYTCLLILGKDGVQRLRALLKRKR